MNPIARREWPAGLARLFLFTILCLVVFAILGHLATVVSFDNDVVVRNRRRRGISDGIHFSSLVAKKRTDLHTGYATAVETLLRGRWHERRRVRARVPCGCVLYTCGPHIVPGRRGSQRFKDFSPGAAQGDLSRNMCSRSFLWDP